MGFGTTSGTPPGRSSRSGIVYVKSPSVAVPRLAAQESGPGGNSSAGNEKSPGVKRMIEFRKRPAVEDIVSERIIFEVGDTRFAIKWTAEIEQLPPARPVAVERKQGLKPNRSPQVRR